MSLDGFIAGPDAKPGQGLGADGELLHYWMFGGKWAYGTEDLAPEAERDDGFGNAGAVICGRKMFDDGEGWGYENPFSAPCFVLSSRMDMVDRAPSFTFVSGGIQDALEQARQAAQDKDVIIAGGASTVQQYLAARLVDEIRIHLVPILMESGTKLFGATGLGPIELEQTKSVATDFLTHLRYRVIKPASLSR
jgi:dihydrofolate reductase